MLQEQLTFKKKMKTGILPDEAYEAILICLTLPYRAHWTVAIYFVPGPHQRTLA